jgi:microfibrillar-associated protein 1
MAADVIKQSMAQANAANEVPDVDDTDGLDEAEEYAAWKLRELLRLKRDKEEREAEEAEIKEIERRRNMTDAEREAEDARLRELEPQEERKKQKFMQKYYHKGAFYQDDDILKRDYSEATGEDTINKEMLPAVMQVKNFGKSGRTKWTHLSAEDTSTRDSPWFQKSDINKRTIEKMGGMHGGFDKPTKRRKA